MNNTNYLKEELYELIKTDEGIFDFIQEFCLDGLWYWDLEHPEEEWMNPKFWSVLGYDHREMPHKASAWQDIIHPEDFELAMENFAKHCENPDYPYDQTVRYTHKNGSTVWIRCRGLVLRDKQGKPVRMLGSHQEITEYKTSQFLLQKSTALLRNSQQVSKTGSWVLDIQTNEVVWTEELYDVYGFDPTLPPPPYTEHMKLFTPESWEILTSSLALTREQGIPYERELMTIRKDGSNGWMWVRGEAVYDKNKNIIGLRGVAQDITERKKGELEKEALTKRLNYALDASGDGIWDWNLAAGTIVFSKAWAEMLGYQMGELAFLTKEWSDRLHPDEIEWVFAEINKVTQTPENGDTFSFEYRFRNKAGEYLWILNKAKVVERNEEGEATRVVGTHTNITDRRQIVEALKENERKLRNLTNNINESSLISITDEKGIIIEINRLFCELSGYTEQELLGNTHSIINSGYHDKQFWKNLWKTITNGEIWRGEIKNRAKDGSEYWVYSVINPVKDSSGKIKQYISIRQNITESKKTQLILQESEKKFRELFENLIDEVHLWKVIKGETGKIIGWQLVDANPPALKTWGKSIHQIIGKTANEIFGSDAHAQFMPIVEKIFQTGKPHIWEEYFPATDQHLYMESIPSGDYFISTGKDVTEQRKIQQALKESELRFAAAIEGTEAGIWDWDMVHNNVVFSKQWKRMLGHEDAEIANSFEGWQNLWHPDDRASIEKAVTEHMNGITQKYEVIHRCRHKDGRWLWIMTRGKILRDENGKPYRWIGTNVDITPQKQAEEDQKIAREQAEKASKAKSEFLANMSHEIRTPLNGVIGFTELLKNTPLNAVQQQYVHSANVSGHTLLGIINDILDFSKIEAGMLELEVIKTDMVELLENSIDIIKFSAADKNLELLLDIDPAMPRFAYADPIRTKQILANLLSNAVKFTHIGEVELKVVFKVLESGLGNLSVFVRDTGIGISEVQKVKLFQSFSQADSSTTRRFGGTGLGLVISQMIAEKMGSKINIESTPDIGSTFFFDISTRFEDGEKPDTTQITGVQRCLIIDDNANNRLILEQMLHQWQIATDTCRNGLEALQILETSQPYDVIICDYDMPYLNGIETIRIMKEKLKLSTEKQPIILLHTSSDNISVHQKCEELGIRFRLHKPVKSYDLFNYLVHCSQTSETILPNKATQEFQPTLQSENIQILIVEDNPFNMLLSKTVLSQIVPNSKIHEAYNGLEAIEQYKNVAPDIIFMDVHMPVCDGIKATKQIREIEMTKGQRTLIIALTAGALKEEKEKCLAAGMDNFFTKPIESQKIQIELDNFWYERKKTTTGLQELPAADEEIHCNYNELLASLDGNTKVVQQLITALMADIPSLINQLQEALRNKDKENIRLIAHSIKGSMLGMRCNMLADIARTIEDDANNDYVENVQLLLLQLEAEWQIVKNILLQKMKS